MHLSAPASFRRPRRSAHAGSVVVLVLVTILLASFLLTKFIERAGTELLADARAADQNRLRHEAYSALEAGLAVLAEIEAVDQGLHGPVQGWDGILDQAGFTAAEGLRVELQVEDESAKFPLPAADPGILAALLELDDLPQAEAERLAQAIIDWVGHPAALGLDDAAYARANPSHRPAGRPLRSFAELAAIPALQGRFFDESGTATALAGRFADQVSLYAYDKVNLNNATPEVLLAAGHTDDQVAVLRTSRGSGRFFRTPEEAGRLLGTDLSASSLGTSVQALRLTVTVQGGASVWRLIAVVAPLEGARLAAVPPPAPAASPAAQSGPPPAKRLDYPFRVLEIREDA